MPSTCSAAETINAFRYLGASVVRKMLELIKLPVEIVSTVLHSFDAPDYSPEFAAKVKKPVRNAREFSPASLLLCQVWNMAVGTKAPISIKKQAKYTVLSFQMCIFCVLDVTWRKDLVCRG